MDKKYLKYYLIFLIAFTIIIGSFAKYKTTLATRNTGTLALPIISLTSDDSSLLILMDETSPNDEQDFFFKVSNKNEDEKLNEVTMTYQLSIKDMENLPLDVKLYEYNEETDKYTEAEMLDGKTIEKEIIQGSLDEKLYKLNIKWRTNEKDYRYSKSIDYIKIIADAVQVD